MALNSWPVVGLDFLVSSVQSHPRTLLIGYLKTLNFISWEGRAIELQALSGANRDWSGYGNLAQSELRLYCAEIYQFPIKLLFVSRHGYN